MGRISICPKTGLKRGTWTPEEDRLLAAYIARYGHWNWRELPKYAGLSRGGKSCRLRWMNYLRPDIKRGHYSKDEEEIITRMHEKLGNRWSAIAACLPGRTDNEIKNHWHTHLSKCTKQATKSYRVEQKPQRCKMEQDQDCFKTLVPATIIPENSTVFPDLSAQKFNDAIDKNFREDDSTVSQASSVLSFAESFLNEELYVPEYPSTLFSPPPMVESFYPCDMLDGYDMDILPPHNNYHVLDSWV